MGGNGSIRLERAKVVRDLRALGFTEHEARVYVSLLANKPATGYEISKDTGLPRGNVYSTIEAMVNKSVAQPIGSHPRKYIPVPAEEVLRRIRSRTDRSCDRVLEVLRGMNDAGDVDYVWHIWGLDEMRSKIQHLIRGARHHISVEGSDASIAAHEADLRDAAHRGVDVIMVVFGSRKNDFGASYLHHNAGMMPIGNVERNLIVTVDFEEAVIASLLDDANGVVTRNPAVVRIVETTIRHDVYLSEIFRVLGPTLDEAFGPALLQLRRRLLPENEVAELETKLKEAGRLPKRFERPSRLRDRSSISRRFEKSAE